MDRAKAMQADRLETNAELAIAHSTMQRAFRSLIMTDKGELKDDDIKKRIDQDIAGAQASGGDFADDATTGGDRFVLQPDAGKRGDGHAMQTVELTITAPPIHAISAVDSTRAQEEAELKQMSLLRTRDTNPWHASSGNVMEERNRQRDAAKGDTEQDAGRIISRADRLSNASEGLTGKAADSTALSGVAAQAIDPPRAPGVRGVFELRPDDDPKTRSRLAKNPDATGAWALWWRQEPVQTPDPVPLPGATDTTSKDGSKAGKDSKTPTTTTTDRTRSLDAMPGLDGDAPEVKLISGLKDAYWQVYRSTRGAAGQRQWLPRMRAESAKELPAFIEFKFETIDGRREDWLFEITWTYGPEPGTVLVVNDPLSNPDANAIAGLSPELNALIQQAINSGGGGANTGGGSTTAGGSKPVTPPTGDAGGAPITNPVGVGTPPGGTGQPGTGAGGTGSGGGGSIVDNGNGTITITLPNGQSITVPKPRH